MVAVTLNIAGPANALTSRVAARARSARARRATFAPKRSFAAPIRAAITAPSPG